MCLLTAKATAESSSSSSAPLSKALSPPGRHRRRASDSLHAALALSPFGDCALSSSSSSASMPRRPRRESSDVTIAILDEALDVISGLELLAVDQQQ